MKASLEASPPGEVSPEEPQRAVRSFVLAAEAARPAVLGGKAVHEGAAGPPSYAFRETLELGPLLTWSS
jgi:hypothetical protein